MGYSRSIKTLEKAMPLLGHLKQGLSCRWETTDSLRLAYKIREALYIAKLVNRQYPDQYADLAKAAAEFKIEILSPTSVQARKAESPTEAVVLAGTEGCAPLVTPVHGLEEAGRAKPTAGAQTALSIVQAWTNAQPSNSQMFFPDAKLNADDLIKLYQFLTAKGWMMMESDGAITIMRPTRDLMGLEWTPADLYE